MTAFDGKRLFISIYRPAGGWLWHNYEEEIVEVMVPRTAELDRIFEVAGLEKTFGATYRGVRQGDSRAKVVEVLGEAEKVEGEPGGGVCDDDLWRGDGAGGDVGGGGAGDSGEGVRGNDE